MAKVSASKTRIDANGNLIGGSGESIEASSSDSSSFENRNDIIGSCSSFLSTARTADFFGFTLPLRQLLVSLAVASLMLGIQGTAVLLAAWCTYNIFLRVTASSIFGSIRSSQSGTSSSRWSGGGGRAWGARASGSGGSNIRGIVDLPCDPVRG